MKLSIDSGTVVCSLENKDSGFLWACAGLFDGFFNGKLKMYWDNPEEFRVPDMATVYNAERLEEIMRYATRYNVEVDETVKEFNGELNANADSIKSRMRADRELQKQREHWERLCRNGCEKCKHLAYDIDLPICKQTGEILGEKNVQKNIGGVLHLFNLEPFPTEDCPFNINKKQGATNECLSEACGSKVQA